jgi:DNA polymerase
VAQGCGSLDELRAALETFDGCPLKATATKLCFADGSPGAELMLIGEAPGAEEDVRGLPFVGPSGQLLDRILAAAGFARSAVWITNCIFWRPPGNRAPQGAEIAICQPFVERQIELLAPRSILFVGGMSARTLLGLTDGVTRLRGRRYLYTSPEGRTTPARVTFHPAYLLRTPANKKLVWRDLLQVRAELEGVAEPA